MALLFSASKVCVNVCCNIGFECIIRPALAFAVNAAVVFIGGEGEPEDKEGESILFSAPGLVIWLSRKEFPTSVELFVDTRLSIEWSFGGTVLLLTVLFSSVVSSDCLITLSSCSFSRRCSSVSFATPVVLFESWNTEEFWFFIKIPPSGCCSLSCSCSCMLFVFSPSVSDTSPITSVLSISDSLLIASLVSFAGDFDGGALDWENLSLFLHLARLFWNQTWNMTDAKIINITLGVSHKQKWSDKLWRRTLENMQSGMCAQRRFRSACASAQFDQYHHWMHFWVAKDAKFLHEDNKDTKFYADNEGALPNVRFLT